LALPVFDGSTWYPFSQRLLFTAENGANGGVWQATLDVPSTVEDISNVMGRGGYEGIQADDHGNLIIVEDSGGAAGSVATHAKQPNSFVYRFIPINETGDTNNLTEAGTQWGGFGAIFRLKLTGPNSGKLSLVYNGDTVHAGFDNCGFWSKDEIVFVEDAGDTLHTQRNGLDSAWLIDLNLDYSKPSNQPIRILAQGRDASATLDSALSGTTGFRNEGDNEITGFHVSDGDPSVNGLLGAKIPHVFHGGWRVFYTQQHGDNVTWEILSKAHQEEDED
jgi:hypothetical protein